MSTPADTCTHCLEESLKCPECQCGCELSQTKDLEDGDLVECMGCGEEWHFWCGSLIDSDEYHENYCDSQAAERYESAAYGDDTDHYYLEARTHSNEREDFHSDG